MERDINVSRVLCTSSWFSRGACWLKVAELPHWRGATRGRGEGMWPLASPGASPLPLPHPNPGVSDTPAAGNPSAHSTYMTSYIIGKRNGQVSPSQQACKRISLIIAASQLKFFFFFLIDWTACTSISYAGGLWANNTVYSIYTICIL